MSNDYFHYQAARDRQVELVRAAEQYRQIRAAVAASDGSAGKGGVPDQAARRRHHRGVRLFGRSPRPTAC